VTHSPTTSSSERQAAGPGADQAALCPYCGIVTPAGASCAQCGGALDPLSIQATQNQMGPWFIHDENSPHRPGCSYQTLRQLAQRGRISLDTVLRGPTTRQFWSMARNARGVAHLLGECHICHHPASEDEYMCRTCGAVFEAPKDRQRFGVGAVRLIPGQTPADVVARSLSTSENEAQASRAAKQSTDVPTQVPTPTEVQPVQSPRGRSSSGDGIAVKRLKRRLNQQKQVVVVSVAANVVLVAVLLISGLSSRFSVKPMAGDAGDGATTNGAVEVAAAESSSAPAGASFGAPTAKQRDDLAEIRRLASTGQSEDLRAAEKLLIELEKESGGGEVFKAELEQLRESIRQRLDAQSLEKFLPEGSS